MTWVACIQQTELSANASTFGENMKYKHDFIFSNFINNKIKVFLPVWPYLWTRVSSMMDVPNCRLRTIKI